MDYTFVPFSSCLDHFIPQKEIKIQSTVGLCYEQQPFNSNNNE